MKIFKNIFFYIISFISLIITKFTKDGLIDSLIITVPTILGILIGTMFTTVVFILNIIINEDFANLDFKKRNIIEENIGLIKNHLFLLLILLILSFFAAYWSNIIFLLCPKLITLYITEQRITIFIQIFSLLLASFSVCEMINVAFNYFEISWELLKKKKIDHFKEEGNVKSIQTLSKKEKK